MIMLLLIVLIAAVVALCIAGPEKCLGGIKLAIVKVKELILKLMGKTGA